MANVKLSGALTRQAMQSTTVRRALEQKADAGVSRVNALGASEGVEMDAKVESGTRPQGRPYSYIVSTNIGQEWGDRWTERRRIMGRAATVL